MLIHMKRIDGQVHREIRVFGTDSEYGAEYVAGLNVTVREDFIEVSLFNGSISTFRTQFLAVYARLIFLRKFYNRPVLAERKGRVLPRFEPLCGDWWIMGE
jgi:hypothetical protein